MSDKRASQIEPRLLSREAAAQYCGVSVPTFEAECPVKAIRFRNRVLYDRAKLDRWIDALSVDNGSGPIPPAGIRAEANPWDHS